MTSDFALNNSMISKEEYLDKKAYYDYQRKVEWNREKCMKICEDLKVLGDDEVIDSSTIFDIMWHKFLWKSSRIHQKIGYPKILNGVSRVKHTPNNHVIEYCIADMLNTHTFIPQGRK